MSLSLSKLPRQSRRHEVHQVRPQVESLEDRTVPTVLFKPKLGDTHVTNPATPDKHFADGDVLRSPNVVWIFAGDYWNKSQQGRDDQKRLRDAALSIMNGPYLSRLTQYGSDGLTSHQALWEWQTDAARDITTGAGVPDYKALLKFVTDQKNANPGKVPGGNNTLFVVIGAPDVSQNLGRGVNYAASGSAPAVAFVGTSATYYGGPPTGPAVTDSFTLTFSHELAEAMAVGIKVSDPAKLNLDPTFDPQIADGEPELQHAADGHIVGHVPYGYRLDGNLVQAYWSQDDGAFVVPDHPAPGQKSQNFVLDPIWSGNTFTGQYKLRVDGDQLGASFPDQVTIDQPAAGLRVTLNGEAVTFEPGNVTSIDIDTQGGTNQVNVVSSPAGVPVTVNSTGGTVTRTGSMSVSDSASHTVEVGGPAAIPFALLDGVGDPLSGPFTRHSVAH
jgi:hypothetical protein